MSSIIEGTVNEKTETVTSNNGGNDTSVPSPVFKIFVGGIDPGVTASMMSQHFSSFGTVLDATIMMDRITGRARGFGFVAMADQESYDAVLEYSNHMFNMKKVDVKPSFENSPPTAGTGGPYGSSKNLHISNLAPTTTAEEIEEFFNKHCEVTEVVLKNGFAFVNTSSINEATNAMNTLQGSDFMGSPLTINYAKDYSQKPNFIPRSNPGGRSRYTNNYNQNQQMGSQPPGMMYHQGNYNQGVGGGMQPSPVLQGSWLPMRQMFNEGHVVDNDGRQWHYTGTDGSIQGPFPSSEMNAWRKHGFFANDDGISMRLAVGGGGGVVGMNGMPMNQNVMNGGNGNLWGNGLNREAGGQGQDRQLYHNGQGGLQGPDLSTQNKIFVGGLDPTVNDEMFGRYFSRFGTVVNAHVMKDRETGHSRGFGFVTFGQESDCLSVLNMSNHEINGKWVELRKAEIPGSTPKGPSAFRPNEEKPPHLKEQFAHLKIFVGGIDTLVSNETLRQHFEKFGKVIDSVVMVDKETLRSRGFGFVTMGDETSFSNVFNVSVSHELNGKIMEVKQAAPLSNNFQRHY